MTAPMSKLEYLKKYMSKEKKEDLKVKKKKLKPLLKAKGGLRIVDEEIDLKKIAAGYEKDEDLLETQEDAPSVAGVVDDRPDDIKTKQDFLESSKWKRLEPKDDAREKLTAKPSHSRESTTKSKVKSESKKLKSKELAQDSGSDMSPPRRRHDSDSDPSPPRRRHDSDSDPSPPRRRHDSDSDPSPPRRRHDSDNSPPRKPQGSKSDQSPPRRQPGASAVLKRPPRSRHDSDSDNSPPRRRRQSDSDPSPPRKRHDSGSDLSPPRRKNKESGSSPRERKPVVDSDGDLSPVRPSKSSSGPSKLAKTLDGKRAGLQTGKALREETEEFRRKEEEAFRKMDASLTGQHATTAIRAGKRREIEAQQAAEKEKAEKRAKLEEAYKKWNKGLKQGAEQSARLADDLHEMDKPLARFAGDEDLEEMLRQQIHEGDPMAEYMAKKKLKSGKGPTRPVYTGPAAAPNRFGILPGYRWDGVDRSNGFEKMYFENKNKAVAIQEEAYKWSVSDM